jgi:hypothetical protein
MAHSRTAAPVELSRTDTRARKLRNFAPETTSVVCRRDQVGN